MNLLTVRNDNYKQLSDHQLSVCLHTCVSSAEQLRCDTSWRVWDLGKGTWWRVLHLTQLPWEIPSWEGVCLHHRRWGFHPSVFSFSLLASVLTTSVPPSPCLDLSPSSSLSPTVHRLILRWQVLNRAILGVQVRPHRGPRRALWFLASHRSLLWAGKPRVRPFQWEVPVHQVCGWRWTGGHRFLCPVQLHARWVITKQSDWGGWHFLNMASFVEVDQTTYHKWTVIVAAATV